MTITIDCRMINSSGIGVYLCGCIPWLLKSNHNFLLLGNIEQLHPYALNKNVKIISCDIKSFSLKELVFFPQKISRQINKTDIFYSPFFNIPCGIKIPVYSTIHDIIFPDMPELVSGIGLKMRIWFYHRAYNKSQKIFTVSNFSKSRIEYHLGSKKPVIITYTAAQNGCLSYRTRNTGISKQKHIMCIGNIKKHKGLACLLDAFRLAKAEGLPHHLVIAGSKDSFRTADNAIFQKINSLNPESLIFTGFVSDEQLMEYLAAAALLIQPSLYEGFGLPPLEAMILGTHALISDIPVFREVYNGFPVTFFRSGDSSDLKNKMLKLLLDKTVPHVSLSKDLAEKYTFEKTASLILHNMGVCNPRHESKKTGVP